MTNAIPIPDAKSSQTELTIQRINRLVSAKVISLEYAKKTLGPLLDSGYPGLSDILCKLESSQCPRA